MVDGSEGTWLTCAEATMNMPPPSEKQARILWFSLTALAIAVLLGVIGLFLWGLGSVLKILTPVLLPLAVAGVIAYLLDPIVDLLQRKGIPRMRAIVLVFFFGVMLVVGLVGTVLPQLVVETGALVDQVPDYARKLQERFENSALGERLDRLWKSSAAPPSPVVTTNHVGAVEGTTTPATAEQTHNPVMAKVLAWTADVIPAIGLWFLAQIQRVGSWIEWIIGFALIPIYVFYFLKEKSGIESNWRAYLPMRESSVKQEVIFILSQINDCLIVFFRGQVLVALCSGTLLTIGFLSMGLHYAFLLGAVAGVLGIIPYLGVLVSLIPAIALAAIQFGDWLHPILVVVIFAIVHVLEGFVISPKIIGDRVGLHPLTIIIAVMIGTTLMGGILGGVLAIPLTAALRTIMFRYVWNRRRS